jgi:hypothetical protein
MNRVNSNGKSKRFFASTLAAVLVIAMGIHAQDITISSVEELEAFRDAVNEGDDFKGKTVTLLNDLDLEGDEDNQWVPIESFAGTFDGSNNVISGVYINTSSRGYSKGLFTSVSGTIKNLGVDVNIKIEGSGGYRPTVGGLVAYNSGTIENSHATGNVEGDGHVGGLVGHNDKGTIENSHATGNVKSDGGSSFYTGGLVGYNIGTIENSYATGNVEGNSILGGLVGINGTNSNSGTIENSHATGNVKGNGPVGGLVGRNDKGTIKNSHASGDIESNFSHAGGLAGSNEDTIENSYATGNVKGKGASTGGLVGTNGGTIENSYATGNVEGGSGSGSYTGGLVGYNANYDINATIKDSYATGNVSGRYAGGLVGYNDYGTIESSYATGDVEGSSYVGGLAGSTRSGTIENSYASGDVKRTGSSTYIGGLVGDSFLSTVVNSSMKTAEQMRQQSTFAGWDFTDVWTINANLNCGYPYLQSIEDAVLLSGECKTTPIRTPQIASGNIIAYAMGNNIVLQNLPSNAKVEVYGLNGKLVSSKSFNQVNQGSDIIPMQTKGVYIVKVSRGVSNMPNVFHVAVR